MMERDHAKVSADRDRADVVSEIGSYQENAWEQEDDARRAQQTCQHQQDVSTAHGTRPKFICDGARNKYSAW